MHRGQRLWSRLSENQHDECQYQRTERDRRFTTELQCDDGNQRCRRKIDEVIAEKNQADQSVRPLQQAVGENGATVARSCLVPELVTIQAH